MKWTGFFFLLIISSSSLAFELPPAFQASYQLEKYGSIVASTQLSLNLKNNNIHYQSRSKAEGLAALFSSDKINEQSVLEYIDSQTPRLLEYHYARKKKPKNNQTIQLNWKDNQTAQIRSNYKNKNVTLTGSQPIWDKLSVQLALISDSQSANNGDAFSYKVIEKNTIKDYRFEYMGDEKIEINNKNYTTHKFKRIHSSGKRVTFMWLAPELFNIPVSIEQQKDNELHWQMTLSDIHIEAN